MIGLTIAAEDLRKELREQRMAHVWRIRREDCDAEREASLLEVLSTDERQRANQFRRDEPRLTYVESRACLRQLLGAYLEQRPAGIRLAANAFGKPRLDASSDAWLSFNLAHSGTYTLVILASERQVGVDVERIRESLDHDQLAVDVFTREERTMLAQLDEPERREAFFTAWARKEAYVKATGRGLSTALDSFCVSVSPAQAARLLWVDGEVTASPRWTLHDIPVAPGYAASAAIEGTRVELRCLDYASP